MPDAFDWNRAIFESRSSLPHLRQSNTIYFVTFRLADSIPQHIMARWQTQLERSHERDRKILARKYEHYLDTGAGDCVLSNPTVAAIVSRAMLHFDASRYLLDDFVIMPNHVHALVCPVGHHGLTDILHSWKSYTSNEINRVLNRHGALWQAESFDHIVRDTDSLQRFRRYIQHNPKRQPPSTYLLGKGSFSAAAGY